MKIQLNSQISILLVIMALLFSQILFAQDSSTKEKLAFKNEFRFFIEGALHKGKDGTENIPLYDRNGDFFFSGVPLATVINYNGTAQGQSFSDKVEAGGFFRGSFGAEFPLGQDITLLTSLGYMVDEISGDLTDGSGGRGSASFNTYIFDLLGFYNLGRHRFGLGASIHLNPQFDYREKGNDFRLKGIYDFSLAIGPSIQYDYLMSKNISMGFRYTDISYDFNKVKISDIVNGTGTPFATDCIANCNNMLDASSFAGHITYRF